MKMITTLQDILNEYKSDMERMEHHIHESLGTDVALIRQVGKYILGAGGKRFRPLLHLLSARLCGYRDHSSEYTLGGVVEFIHTASLLHDDVIDEAGLRRGRSSANSLWGNQASILVGDYLYSKALYHAVRLQNQRVMDVLSETTTAMSEGEVLQLMHIQNVDISEADYFTVPVAAEEPGAYADIPPEEIPRLIQSLQKEMREAAKSLEFERAAELRDRIQGLKEMQLGIKIG